MAQPDPAVKPQPALRAVQVQVAAAEVVAASAAKATNSAGQKGQEDLLEFLSGDTLRGRFLGWEASTGIRWQHEGVEGELRVIPQQVHKFRLQRPAARPPETMHGRLLLRNGDLLSVKVVSLDTQQGSFESWYAGALQVPRAAISNLTLFFAQGDLLYHGPTGLDGWQQSQPGPAGAAILRNAIVVDGKLVAAREERPAEEQTGAWIFNGEALEATRPGAVGRDFKLPRQSMITMEIEAPNIPALTLHIYSDATDRFTALNALSFTFSGRMIYCRRSLGTGGSRQIGNMDHQRFASGTPTRVKLTLCTDLDRQVAAIYMDDVLVRNFSVAGQVEGLGTGLVILQQAAASLKISNLTIRRWNGMVEDTAATTRAVKEDWLLLNNRDKISGKLLAIREGKVEFETTYSKVEIPLERIMRIVLAVPDAAPGPDVRSARLLLRDAERLTLQVQRWNQEVVEGSSPLFGSLKVNARAVLGVQFE